jgi:ADP-dependent NAD(P)H-hydrate dehydratase / NAD(P)H-hydrate epimerase
MQKVLSAEEMREVDRQTSEKYGIPSILLMENAAHAAARIITEKLDGSVEGKSFLILCGKGNNGGDGAVLARILAMQGAKVNVYLTGTSEDSKGDAKINFQMLEKLEKAVDFIGEKGRIDQFSNSIGYFELRVIENYEHWQKLDDSLMKIADHFDVFVDALFGTGLTRPLEGFYNAIPDFFNSIYNFNDRYKSRKPLLVSIDIPSGLNADSAQQIGKNIQSNLTVTFTAPKLANVLPPASNFNGELVVASIGSPQELIDASPSKTFLYEKQDAKEWLEKTKFTSDSYKNKRGHALLIAGSNNYAGAAVLSGNSAIVSGVGLVTIAAPESAQTAIASRVLPEVMTRGVAETKGGAVSEEAFKEISEFIEKSIDAVAVGSGLSSSEESTRKLVRKIVEERKTPLVIDADGLNSLAPFDLQGNDELPLILTPHEGEFLKLLGTKDKEVLKDRVKVVRDFAEKHKVILVLKGERVLTAAPDGRVVINPTGNSGLGKAGNGDTLTGIITGFVAQAAQMKVDIFETVVAAVYISSLAGDIAAEKYGKRTMLASDVRECLTDAFKEIL